MKNENEKRDKRGKMKMNKLFGLLLAGSMVLTGCSSSASATEDSSNVLRVGMECAYAPFNWTQETAEVADGSTAVPIYQSDYYAYGYDVMVSQMIADELGMELEVHKVEWDSIGLGLTSGEYDAIVAGMGYTQERDASYDFTDPYYFRENVIVVRADSEYASFTKLSDFAGTGAVGTTQLGTCWVGIMDQVPGYTQGAYYSTTAECFMAVSNGAADFTIIDLPTSQSALLTNPDLKILELDENDTLSDPTGATNVCIAVAEGDSELQQKIQDAMDALDLDKDKMNELMGLAIELQPASN